MSSNTVLVILVTALVLGGGVVLGATLFVSGGAPESEGTPAMPERHAPVEPAEPPPVLRGEAGGPAAEVSTLEARLAAVEEELRRLKEAQEKTRADVEPILEMAKMAERLQEGGIAVEGLPLDVLGLEEGRLLREHGPRDAEKIADLLALDPARRQAFEEAHAALIEKLKALEAEHAEVTENEDGLTIEVGAFPADGERLQREWDDFIGRTLTPEEHERYRRHRLENALFQHGFGKSSREITVKDVGGNLEIQENAKGPEGHSFRTVTQGPAEAREMMLEPYAHLLK